METTPIKHQPINRRKFVGSLGLFGMLAGMRPLAVFPAPTSREDPQQADGIVKCKPYLQAAHPEGITVRWITHQPCHSWVEYGLQPNQLDQKARQIEEGMVQVDNTIHAIPIEDLKPGQTYYYRSVSAVVENLNRKEIAFGEPSISPVYSFTTPAQDQQEASFLVFNDIHDRPESFAHLLQFQEKGKKDFVFLNGDMFNLQQDENQIVEHLLHPVSDAFATQTPFIFGRGNHETWGFYARNTIDYFDGGQHTFYHSFQYGPLYGIVLDTGETKPDEDPVNGGIMDFDTYREVQAQWLAREVQKEAFKKAKFRIAFIHIPPYYMKEAHASAHHRELWVPIFNENNIDLMLCGHTHRHGIHPPVAGKHTFPIVIGGGPKDGQRTLIEVNVTQERLKLNMTDDSGALVGSLDLPVRV